MLHEQRWPVTDRFVHDAAMPRVVFGPGSIDSVAEEVESLGGERVLLISTRSATTAADRISAALDARVVGQIDEVAMHVPAELAARVTEDAIRQKTDLAVCLGGGSALGLGKAIALESGLSLLAIPTTYAGSEMTSIWGKTLDGEKATGRDPKVLPKTVVYDPELTIGYPANQSAASGMNAAAHCVEALYSSSATPVTNLLAQQGLKLLAQTLPEIVENPAELTARSKALQAAWFSGWVLGATQMGLHHKLCHVLGGSYNLPHSGVHSALLPYVTSWMTPHAPVAMESIGMSLGAAPAGSAIWALTDRIGAPTSLAAVGFDVAHIDDVTEQMVADSASSHAPGGQAPVTKDAIRRILLASCDGSLSAAESLSVQPSTD